MLIQISACTVPLKIPNAFTSNQISIFICVLTTDTTLQKKVNGNLLHETQERTKICLHYTRGDDTLLAGYCR